ncbi:MAG: type II secretion system GspH family protein [Gemmatimonadota bacterium]|nr:type II secretion system GspH family protein [Gemmatimonadota bacterium]MDH3367483.1 type II secretion system GspH family protein [Gemmatimonadota bacterium]MDH3477461.1 type II secretion system GspH family protein [Gemmatimonadota bacterium]MDH3569418.1 type II secretion system GspH family protein [Gemmatimonadota bacterium]MDH5549248.1 type II secretion system GspH family protein [Gemmatimonadota bacterium]
MTRTVTGTGRPGFTLIEVVVVLTILGIAAAVTAPGLARMLGGGADGVVRDVVSAYGTAREAAATRAARTSVLLELGTGAYWVVAGPSAGDVADTIRQGRLSLTPEIRLTGGDRGWAVTTFDPLGHARGNRVFVSEGQEVHEIAADPWTAAVSVQRR